VNVAAYPGVEDGLLGGVTSREDLASYRKTGGYAELDDPAALLSAVRAVGLRGRGGAAFPLATKIDAVRRAGPHPVVVANGEEGEPGSVKDRWLMRTRPHLVLDGLRRAAAMTGADELHAYVSDDECASSLAQAAAETGTPLRVTQVARTYVAGEETALVRAINGGPALPEDKPPRPYQAGVSGRPTLVSNVETLAHLPLIRHGGVTFLLSLGDGLYEVPLGTTLREVLTWRGEDVAVAGVLMGGYFGGLLGPRALDLPLDHDTLRAEGSGLGCGAVALLPAAHCPVAAAADVLAYFARQNAGQCGSCFNGTAGLSLVAGRLTRGEAAPGDLERFRRWSVFLPGRGACGTLDGAALMAASLLREFPAVVAGHAESGARPCARCHEGQG
jgi:NADH:ubiquinone oxidoreductase subunit F (NADH-binding)